MGVWVLGLPCQAAAAACCDGGSGVAEHLEWDLCYRLMLCNDDLCLSWEFAFYDYTMC